MSPVIVKENTNKRKGFIGIFFNKRQPLNLQADVRIESHLDFLKHLCCLHNTTDYVINPNNIKKQFLSVKNITNFINDFIGLSNILYDKVSL